MVRDGKRLGPSDREHPSSGAPRPLPMEITDTEREEPGIPAWVFRSRLGEEDRPGPKNRVLEVTLLWRNTLMQVGHYTETRRITVGEGPRNDFRLSIEQLPSKHFPLIETTPEGFAVQWTGRMTMGVRVSNGAIQGLPALNRRKALDELSIEGVRGLRYTLDLDDRVAIQMGNVTFVVQYVSPARAIPTRPLQNIDRKFVGFWAASLLVHLCAWTVLKVTPIPVRDINDDLFNKPNRFTQLLLAPLSKPEEKKRRGPAAGSKGGARHKDKEGKFGKPERPKKDALASVPGAARVDPKKYERDRRVALRSGLLAALGGIVPIRSPMCLVLVV